MGFNERLANFSGQDTIFWILLESTFIHLQSQLGLEGEREGGGEGRGGEGRGGEGRGGGELFY